MDNYVVLATRMANPNDWESEECEWKVGTFDQAAYWVQKWEEHGFTVHVRRCTNPLNTEFVKARIEKVAQA